LSASLTLEVEFALTIFNSDTSFFFFKCKYRFI